ncbi:hypothetical protein [Xylanibacillus composti]|nr:hypothetical protein [Xylanibacillus composti]
MFWLNWLEGNRWIQFIFGLTWTVVGIGLLCRAVGWVLSLF